jgi:hypothetical protein
VLHLDPLSSQLALSKTAVREDCAWNQFSSSRGSMAPIAFGVAIQFIMTVYCQWLQLPNEQLLHSA